MATNIEIKARVQDFAALQSRAEAISDGPVERISQEDIFFQTPRGRLKLRILNPEHGQLIFYMRPDTAGPKRSDYFISVTNEPDSLKLVLASSLGVRGIVRKERWLYWVSHTRIHLDQVEDLGAFIELEVMLQAGQQQEQGEQIAAEIMARLGVEESNLIEGAYIDLLSPSSID